MDNSNITKCKLFFSLDKELEFINKMNREGWKLVYIKCGCFYTFEKTEPDEYFTVLHATAKEKVLELSSFAAQCGYQPIPHTMDGFGDLLYLTARKNRQREKDISTLSDFEHYFRSNFRSSCSGKYIFYWKENDFPRGFGCICRIRRAVYDVYGGVCRYVHICACADSQGAAEYEAAAKRK